MTKASSIENGRRVSVDHPSSATGRGGFVEYEGKTVLSYADNGETPPQAGTGLTLDGRVYRVLTVRREKSPRMVTLGLKLEGATAD